MEYIKYKLTGSLIVAFSFLSACNNGGGSGYWKSCKIIDIYTQSVEKRLDRLGTYLIFTIIPLLLLISMQLGALIIYTFS